MESTELPDLQSRIVPELRKIQDKYGYLNREALLEFHRDSEIPLYQLQAVASFFPHFRLTEPPKDIAVTVQVCRDMACHMKGSAATIKRLQKIPGAHVEGVSCLGRCDRAPATCVMVHTSGEEHFYLGRTDEGLEKVIHRWLSGLGPTNDDYATEPSPAVTWKINPYVDQPNYAAVKRAAELRTESIKAAANHLIQAEKWSAARAEEFTSRALAGNNVKPSEDPKLYDAVCAWQVKKDWAAAEKMSDWTDPLLAWMGNEKSKKEDKKEDKKNDTEKLEKKPEDETEEKRQADLRGMGGAGISAATKWRDVRDAVRTARLRRDDDRAYIVVNGDESEPGTFKDRELLLRFPHLIVEGVLLAGLITEATEGFIYIRHEYHEQIEACEKEIARAERAGLCGKEASVLGRPFPVSVFVSPGGYICGEQSALIEAMSGRRGEPRNLPPNLETNGLYNQPTLVSNVETFAWVPFIILNGGEAYEKMGVNGWRGRRFFSVCGDVNRPGVYECPMGMTLRELIFGEQYCRGIVGGKTLKALAPSGPSGGFIPARLVAPLGLPRDHTKNEKWLALAARRGFDPASNQLDILDLELELDLFRALSPTQMLGAGLVVYAEGRDMVEQAVNSMEFYGNESCGKCVPCRIGSQKLVALGHNLLQKRIDSQAWNDEVLDVVRTLGKVMKLTSICGLGKAIPESLRTVIDFFPEDLAPYLQS